MVYTFKSPIHHWDPSLITEKGDCLSGDSFALIILNHSLDKLDSSQIDYFKRLWKSAKFRLSVDGGTNRLADYDQSLVPHCISGDLDSIKDSTLNRFKKLGVEIIETPDQDDTDFTKALLVLNDKSTSGGLKIDYIVVLWQITHRLDHTFAIISTLYKWFQMKEADHPVFIVDLKGSLSWLLPTGEHHIMSTLKPKMCSVVPFNGPATVTSTGLEYNMDKTILSFGSLISTSNKLDSSMDKVVLQVERQPVLWSQYF